jgi:hypothetical protein
MFCCFPWQTTNVQECHSTQENQPKPSTSNSEDRKVNSVGLKRLQSTEVIDLKQFINETSTTPLAKSEKEMKTK